MAKKYRVAIDTGPLSSGHAVRGIGVNTSELIKAIDNISDKEIDVDAIDFKKSDLSKYDLAHYQFFHPFFLTLPIIKKTKSLVTIHDLINLIYPKAYPPGLKGTIKFKLQKYLINKLDGIITISQTSRKDIMRFLGVNSDKIRVIYLAPKGIYRKIEDEKLKADIVKKYSLPKQFVLYVGDVNYNKNVLSLADACKKVKIPLVIVGKQAKSTGFDINHPENKPFIDFLKKYGEDKDIIRLGFVRDEDLVVIYNLATVYCQPSYYEGFGLPLLEAMSCETPVVASDIEAHKEIAGQSVIYIDPNNVNDIAEKIRKIVESHDLREDYVKRGFEQTKKYSWNKTAKETLKVYKLILEKNQK